MPRTRSAVSVLTIGSLLALTGGCGEDAGRQAVETSRIELQSVAGSNGVGQDAGDYSALVTTLSERVNDLSGGAEEALSVVLGSARSGRAGGLNREALAAEFELSERVHVLRGHVARWSRLNAQSEAAGRIDVTDELRDLRERQRARLSEAEIEAGRAAELGARAADLQAQIDDLRGRALQERSAAGELELTLPSTPAVEAPAVAARIRAYLLRSDELDAEAERVEMARGQVLPELREAELRTEQLREQARLLGAAQEDAQNRQRRAEDDARQTAAAAGEAAGAIETLMGELESLRTGEFTRRFDAASRELSAAASDARNARSVAAASGSMTAGAAQQFLGGLHLRRSTALLEVARLHEYIAELGVPVSSDAQGITEEAQEAHEQGTNAYASAASALRAARIRGDVGQRLTELADILDRISEVTLGGVPNLAPPPAEEEDSFGDDFMDDDFAETDNETDEPADDVPADGDD